jgi:hypothetical protein
VSPDTAHFHERSELSPFQFVNKVINFVGTTHKFRLRSVDCDLDLAVNNVVKFGIDQDVMGSLFEPVFDSDDFEFVRNLITHSLKLLENFEYLFLLGRILASKKI